MAYAILTWHAKTANKVGIRIETIARWRTTAKSNATQIWFTDGSSMVATQSFEEIEAMTKSISQPHSPQSIIMDGQADAPEPIDDSEMPPFAPPDEG